MENPGQIQAGPEAPTVFVIDDDRSFLAGMKRFLTASGFKTETFQCPREFRNKGDRACAGCVLADLQMPGLDGLELQEELARSDDPLPVVFLTGQGDIPTSVSAMRGGAEDFLTKLAPKEEILAAIGRAFERDELERAKRRRKQDLLARFDRLTPREAEVLAHVLTGQLNKQIAGDLGIDERSVKRHRTSFMAKIGVQSVAELAQLAAVARVTHHPSEAGTRVPQATF